MMSRPVCSECGEPVRECDYCGEKFREGDGVICVSFGAVDLHYCSEDCLYDDIEERKVFAKIEKGWRCV